MPGGSSTWKTPPLQKQNKALQRLRLPLLFSPPRDVRAEQDEPHQGKKRKKKDKKDNKNKKSRKTEQRGTVPPTTNVCDTLAEDDPLLEPLADILYYNDAPQLENERPLSTQADAGDDPDLTDASAKTSRPTTSSASTATSSFRGISPTDAGAARAVPWAEWPDEVKALTIRRNSMHDQGKVASATLQEKAEEATILDEPNDETYYKITRSHARAEDDTHTLAGDLPVGPQTVEEDTPWTTGGFPLPAEVSQDHAGLHPSQDVFADEPYMAGASFAPMEQKEAEQEPTGETPDDFSDLDHAGDSANYQDDQYDLDLDHADDSENYQDDQYDLAGGVDSSPKPSEPAGAPSGLTPRQKQRLQQLLAGGHLNRLHDEETDAMVWKRYRDETKQSYRALRKQKRRYGEWTPDLQRR